MVLSIDTCHHWQRCRAVFNATGILYSKAIFKWDGDFAMNN
jgi:hypothetical protein